MAAKPVHGWSEAYVVQIPDVDAQHKGLFDLAFAVESALHQNMEEKIIDDALSQLLAYVQKHFTYEEQLMTTSTYPRFHRHLLEHDDFTRQVLEFRELREKGSRGVAQNIAAFLKSWFAGHIMQEDRKLAYFLHKSSTSGAPAAETA